MKKLRLALAFFGALLLTVACTNKSDFSYYYYEAEDYATLTKYLNLPDIPHEYTVEFPSHLRSAGLFPRPVERDKAILGRVLFYDKNLSKDGKIACASCHKQEIGFGDDKVVSKGVYDRDGDRNSLPLASVSNFSAYYGTDLNGSLAVPFFWDNRANTVAEQAKGAIENEKEMSMHMNEVAISVQNQPYYGPLFKKAFGDANVSEDRVLESIANFINAMGSFQSKFDEAASKQNPNGWGYDPNGKFDGFTDAEKRGKDIYMANCASCHSNNMGRPVALNANNGLDAVTSDPGVGKTTGLSKDDGTFKIPTLRNIALTAPYMHDGRFATLEQVIEHYSTGIQKHPNLSPLLKTGGNPKRLNLNTGDKSDLLAFLNTLTDEHVKTDQRFANPFK